MSVYRKVARIGGLLILSLALSGCFAVVRPGYWHPGWWGRGGWHRGYWR